MMTEQLRYMQVQLPNITGLVEAMEFRHTNERKTWTVTVIDETGHRTITAIDRMEAIITADMHIEKLVKKLKEYYGL